MHISNQAAQRHGNAGRSSGFTLIELMITMTVVAVLLAMIMPGFRGLIQDQRISTSVNELLSAIYFARSEAVKRRVEVIICKSSDGAKCADGLDWGEGWLVFVNNDVDDDADTSNDFYDDDDDGDGVTDEVIFQGDGLSNEIDVVESAQYADIIRFSDNGSVHSNGSLIFCDARGTGHARAIVMSLSGRPRVSDEDTNGDPYSCP